MSHKPTYLRVAVRVRPSPVPTLGGRSLEGRTLSVIEESGPFNAVFGPASSQHAVYAVCGAPLLDGVFEEGLSGCLFAFGATGSGKTHSMLGASGGQARAALDGIIPQLSDDLFRRATRLEADAAASGLCFTVTATFVEVLEDRTYDLLSQPQRGPGKGGLSARRAALETRATVGGRIVAHGASEIAVTSTRALLELVGRGARARATRATGVHDHSSRSHALLTLAVDRRWTRPSDGATLSRVAQVQLVDLAGAESMTRAHGGAADRAGCAVNAGLLVLGRVLEGLAARGSVKGATGALPRLPFRDSTLTRLLETALGGGGSGRTWMLATVSPDEADAADTAATLRWAATARRVAVRGDATRVVELAEASDPMRGDVADPDPRLRRRCVTISTVAHGDLFARAAGDPADPLVLLVHGSGPRNSSLQWNFLPPRLMIGDEAAGGVGAGLYLVAIDCPGYGRSPGDRQTVRSHPGVLLMDVVHSLGKAVAHTLVGSSQGAAAVLNAALECPDIAHFLAVVHPVGHAPRRYTAIPQPTLLMFDVVDDGHPVRVGRLMRQYLQRPHYSEWSGRAEPGYLQARFAGALRAMWGAYAKPPHASGLAGLPDLTRCAGGLRAWMTPADGEDSHGNDDCAGGYAELCRNVKPSSTDVATEVPDHTELSDGYFDEIAESGDCDTSLAACDWHIEINEATGIITYVNALTGERAFSRPATCTPRSQHMKAADGTAAHATEGATANPGATMPPLAPLTAHAAARLAAAAAARADAASAALLETHACSRCSLLLAEPTRLHPCGHIQCGACAGRFARYCGRCTACGSVVTRREPASAAHVSRIAERIAAGELDADEFECQSRLAAECAASLVPGPGLIAPIVLEFGNSASPPGPEDPRTRRAMRTFLTVVSSGHEGTVRSVSFDVNPGVPHRVPAVERPPYECERSMARPFPCYVSVSFVPALCLPPLLLKYKTQHTVDRVVRRVVIHQLVLAAKRRGGPIDPVVVDLRDLADVWIAVDDRIVAVERN